MVVFPGVQQCSGAKLGVHRVLLALGGVLDMVGGLPDMGALRRTGAFLSRDS